MNSMAASKPHHLVLPDYGRSPTPHRLIKQCAKELNELTPRQIEQTEAIRNQLLDEAAQCGKHAQAVRTTICILYDLHSNGWKFKVQQDKIQLTASSPHGREEIRLQHTRGRDDQLRKESTRKFVREMERRKLGPEGWSSIFDLMRDGRGLAESLQAVTKENKKPSLAAYKSIIDPYVQLAERGQYCEFTGLQLSDIWRYFRHTWVTTYNTVPGRTMMLLIRDRAADSHPVIGIAALSSPVAQLGRRDDWIGWSSDAFFDFLETNASLQWAKWIHSSLIELIDEIYTADLIGEGVIRRGSLKKPRLEDIENLKIDGERYRLDHQEHPNPELHKHPTESLTNKQWQIRSKDYLYRWKRSVTLAVLLQALHDLRESDFLPPTKASLLNLLQSRVGHSAINTVRRHMKQRAVGNNILDITVCGALPPYNQLLGGKLVAMLMTSREMCDVYEKKYGKVESIIASSMAGRSICRKAKLMLLTTTSLYGRSMNQYTRISIPCGKGDVIRFASPGKTEGQGSFHFSEKTVENIATLKRQKNEGPRVNYIFGEGVSPKLRSVRDSLDQLGFPSDAVLTHGSKRIMYVVTLVRHTLEILMAKRKRPEYLLQGPAEAVTKQIIQHWMNRWMLKRVEKEETRNKVQEHCLVQPIEHGARVVLPQIEEEEPLLAGLSD